MHLVSNDTKSVELKFNFSMLAKSSKAAGSIDSMLEQKLKSKLRNSANGEKTFALIVLRYWQFDKFIVFG